MFAGPDRAVKAGVRVNKLHLAILACLVLGIFQNRIIETLQANPERIINSTPSSDSLILGMVIFLDRISFTTSPRLRLLQGARPRPENAYGG